MPVFLRSIRGLVRTAFAGKIMYLKSVFSGPNRFFHAWHWLELLKVQPKSIPYLQALTVLEVQPNSI
jgi:hypothetical protein